MVVAAVAVPHDVRARYAVARPESRTDFCVARVPVRLASLRQRFPSVYFNLLWFLPHTHHWQAAAWICVLCSLSFF
jgi:hypothetical protein